MDPMDPDLREVRAKVQSFQDIITALELEVKRLKEGFLTPEEFQNLCHNLHLREGMPCTREEFREGCRKTEESFL